MNFVLIPKCDMPTFMKDLRPMALCNMVYKILSKVLANPLKTILSKLVSQEQSTFVLYRAITDNVLISFEAIHYMKMKTMGKQGETALKIDISKAYERVN